MNRREMLKSAGLAGIATLSTSLTSATSLIYDEKRSVGYAIIGLGGFANYVIPRLKSCSKSKVAALVTADKNKAKEWINRYQLTHCAIYGYEEFNQISKDKNIDAVYIATPVGTHEDFALRAFNAGKHVLTEKTMAANAEQATNMIAASQKVNRKLMVAYRVRYEPYNQACIDYAKNETFGKVSSIAAHKGFFIDDKLGKNNWRTQHKLAGGGALVDIGIYSIQACRYLAGMEPSEVFGFDHSTYGDQRFNEVEENISFNLKFPSGILATGSASWNYSLQNFFRVGTSKGYFELQPATSNMNLRMIVKQDDIGLTGERSFPNIDQIPAMFDHFSTCILEDKEPKTSGEEGLKDLLVIEAIYRSIKEKRPVSL